MSPFALQALIPESEGIAEVVDSPPRFWNQIGVLYQTDETAAETEEPLAPTLQSEHIDEPKPGEYAHVTTERITEWPLELLNRPRRTERTIPDFLSPDAPPNSSGHHSGIGMSNRNTPRQTLLVLPLKVPTVKVSI